MLLSPAPHPVSHRGLQVLSPGSQTLALRSTAGAKSLLGCRGGHATLAQPAPQSHRSALQWARDLGGPWVKPFEAPYHPRAPGQIPSYGVLGFCPSSYSHHVSLWWEEERPLVTATS